MLAEMTVWDPWIKDTKMFVCLEMISLMNDRTILLVGDGEDPAVRVADLLPFRDGTSGEGVDCRTPIFCQFH